jgi:hypothetical protein
MGQILGPSSEALGLVLSRSRVKLSMLEYNINASTAEMSGEAKEVGLGKQKNKNKMGSA